MNSNIKASFDEQIININSKPISMNEDSEFKPSDKNPYRVIRDQTTDSFIEVFFSKTLTQMTDPIEEDKNEKRDALRNLFLMYVYNKFKLDIEAEFNIYLMENKCEILETGEEFADFLFKGGNVMFIIIEKLLKKNRTVIDKSGLPVEIKSQYIKNLRDYPILSSYIKEAFGISDFDFTIYLKCKNHKKMVKKKKYL